MQHDLLDRRIAHAMFLSLWVLYAFIGPGVTVFNPNSVSRMAFVFTTLQDHSPVIDAFAPLTIDKAVFAGHTFMDKAPGLSLMAVPAVALVDLLAALTGLSHAPLNNGQFTYFFVLDALVAVAFTTALWTAAAAAVMYLFARHLRASRAASCFAALGFGLCTPALGWATVFFSHAVTGSGLFIGFVATMLASEPVRSGESERRRMVLAGLAGALLSWSVVVEFTSAVSVLLIAGAGCWRLRRLPTRARITMMASALICGFVAFMPLVLYNLWAFGAATHLGYSDVVGFDGMQQGMFGVSLPRPEIVLAMLVGLKRGLLWIAPILTLVPLAWAAAWRRMPGALLLVLIAVPVSTFLIVSGYAYWDGGGSIGPRHVIPAVPFACLALASLWDTAGRRVRLAMLSLALVSFVLSLICASVLMIAPIWIENPLPGFILPLLMDGEVHTALTMMGARGQQWLIMLPVIGLLGLKVASAIAATGADCTTTSPRLSRASSAQPCS